MRQLLTDDGNQLTQHDDEDALISRREKDRLSFNHEGMLLILCGVTALLGQSLFISLVFL